VNLLGWDGEYAYGLAGNDVFIVEGEQERYGRKDAWAVARPLTPIPRRPRELPSGAALSWPSPGTQE